MSTRDDGRGQRSRRPLWLVEGLDIVEQRRGPLLGAIAVVVLVPTLLAVFAPSVVPPTPLVGAAVAIAALLLGIAAALAADTTDLVVRGPRHVGAAGGELVAILPSRVNTASARAFAASVLEAREPGAQMLLGIASAGREADETAAWTDALAEALVRVGGVSALRIDLATGRTDRPGLSEVVKGQLRLADAVEIAPDMNLARLATGDDPIRALRALPGLPGRLPGDLDVLLVALPSATNREVVAACKALDHLLVMAHRDRTSRVQLIAALDAIDSTGTDPQVVLIDDPTVARIGATGFSDAPLPAGGPAPAPAAQPEVDEAWPDTAAPADANDAVAGFGSPTPHAPTASPRSAATTEGEQDAARTTGPLGAILGDDEVTPSTADELADDSWDAEPPTGGADEDSGSWAPPVEADREDAPPGEVARHERWGTGRGPDVEVGPDDRSTPTPSDPAQVSGITGVGGGAVAAANLGAAAGAAAGAAGGAGVGGALAGAGARGGDASDEGEASDAGEEDAAHGEADDAAAPTDERSSEVAPAAAVDPASLPEWQRPWTAPSPAGGTAASEPAPASEATPSAEDTSAPDVTPAPEDTPALDVTAAPGTVAATEDASAGEPASGTSVGDDGTSVDVDEWHRPWTADASADAESEPATMAPADEFAAGDGSLAADVPAGDAAEPAADPLDTGDDGHDGSSRSASAGPSADPEATMPLASAGLAGAAGAAAGAAMAASFGGPDADEAVGSDDAADPTDPAGSDDTADPTGLVASDGSVDASDLDEPIVDTEEWQRPWVAALPSDPRPQVGTQPRDVDVLMGVQEAAALAVTETRGSEPEAPAVEDATVDDRAAIDPAPESYEPTPTDLDQHPAPIQDPAASDDEEYRPPPAVRIPDSYLPPSGAGPRPVSAASGDDRPQPIRGAESEQEDLLRTTARLAILMDDLDVRSHDRGDRRAP